LLRSAWLGWAGWANTELEIVNLFFCFLSHLDPDLGKTCIISFCFVFICLVFWVVVFVFWGLFACLLL